MSFDGELILPAGKIRDWIGGGIELPRASNSLMIRKVTNPEFFNADALVSLILSNNVSDECKEDLLEALKKEIQSFRFAMEGTDVCYYIDKFFDYKPNETYLRKFYECFLGELKKLVINDKYVAYAAFEQIISQFSNTEVPDDLKPEFIEAVKIGLKKFEFDRTNLEDMQKFIEKQGYHLDDVTRGIKIRTYGRW